MSRKLCIFIWLEKDMILVQNKERISMKYYIHCKDTPLRVFKDAVSGNLEALIIEGEVPINELKVATATLMDEFNTLTNNSKYKAFVQDISRKYYLESMIYMYSICLDFSDDVLKRKLRMTPTKLKARIDRYKFELQMLQEQKQQSEDKEEFDVYRYYSELQVEVSKKLKFIVPDDISVYNFALMVNDLWRKI